MHEHLPASQRVSLQRIAEIALVLLERLEVVLSARGRAASICEQASDEAKRNLNQAVFEPFVVNLVDDSGRH